MPLYTSDYPIIQALHDYKSSVSVEKTTLEQLDKVPAKDPYLNELVSQLQDYQKYVKTSEDFVQSHAAKQPSMKEALMLLFEVFFQNNKLLQDVEQRLVICPPDINSENLRQLKQHLSEFNGFLDQIIMHYSGMSNGTELPLLEEVKNSIAGLRENIDLAGSMSYFEFNADTHVNGEQVLCLLLGLQSCLADRLANLMPVVRGHHTDMYLLFVFLCDHCESLEMVEELANKEGVTARLHKMGFTESRSKGIASWITEQPLWRHQSLLTWAELYIGTVFEYNVFLTKYVAGYPYEEKRLEEWFEVSIQWEYELHDLADTITTKVALINTTPQLASEVIRIKEDQVGSSLWFHATDHKVAVRILEDGINLGAGGFKRDFSHGYGFYLMPDSKHALAWATKLKAGAVIIFKVPDDMLSCFKCLDLRSDQEAWETIVKYNRHGKWRSERPSKALNDKYRQCDYIIGSICRNGIECNIESWQPLGFGNGEPQICVKSNRMAKCIGNRENIHGIVFINSPLDSYCCKY